MRRANFSAGSSSLPGKTAKPILSPNFKTVLTGSRASNSLIFVWKIGIASPPPSLPEWSARLIAFVSLVLFDIQAAVILTMLFIFTRISGPAMAISETLQQFASAVPAHAEFLQLERDLTVPDVRDQLPAMAITSGPVVFRDVSFHYERSGRSGAGIERLNLTIAPGTFLGVSGPTGAGKTTFADLLIGLLEPHAGEISVGGMRLHGAAAVRWRDHVSYGVQDPYLFRDTIRRNLLWANPQASEAQI
jgi:ABC-type multidrug transport system fused ATPase/permease subunit